MVGPGRRGGRTRAAKGRAYRGVRYALPRMILFGLDQATGTTLALIATFGGVGVIVNLLVVYIIAQVLAERRENQEYHEREGV